MLKEKEIKIFKFMEDLMNDHLIKKEKGDIFEMKYKDIAIWEYTSSNLQVFKIEK